jgi:predicted HicB family RNase H-like nuclease
MNLMTVDGYHAKIDYDEETDQFRGEILGLSGGADFYGSSPEELRREFKKSLEVFLEVCKEKGIEPRRHYSGKFNLRIPPELHEKLAMTAEAQGKSLNSLAITSPSSSLGAAFKGSGGRNRYRRRYHKHGNMSALDTRITHELQSELN